jgi:hypothetical protein
MIKTHLRLKHLSMFLLSYLESLLQIKNYTGKDISKGKFILDKEEMEFHNFKEQTVEPELRWTTHLDGWCKLNTDGSFAIGGEA